MAKKGSPPVDDPARLDPASEAKGIADGSSAPTTDATLPPPQPIAGTPPVEPAGLTGGLGATARTGDPPPPRRRGRPPGSKNKPSDPTAAAAATGGVATTPLRALTPEQALIQAAQANELYGAALVMTLGDDAALKPPEREALNQALGGWMLESQVVLPSWATLITLYCGITIAKMRTPTGAEKVSGWWNRIKVRIFKWRVRNEPGNSGGGRIDDRGGAVVAIGANNRSQAGAAETAARA